MRGKPSQAEIAAAAEMCGAPPPLTDEETTLHRYLAWADKLRQYFIEERNRNGMGPDSWMLMSMWFVMLAATIEGWRSLRLRDDAIRALLRQHQNVKLLRDYRHSVAHFDSTKYWNDRFNAMIAKQDTAGWADGLTSAFNVYFERRYIETDHPAVRHLAKTARSERR